MGRATMDKPGTEAEIIAINDAATACAGHLYRSTDTIPEKVWFGADDGTLIGPFITEANAGPRFYGDFDNDTTAGAGGVPLQGIYFLTLVNDYGQPEGTAKKRIEQP